MNITHESPDYLELRNNLYGGKNNGCWFYAKEIAKNIIPNVKTNREWNTVGRELEGMHDGMILFLHDNATPWHYSWLKNYNDLVLVCSSQYTADSVKYWGHIVLLPMSVDVEYVKKFRVKEKTKDTCFVGNPWVKQNIRSMTSPNGLPNGVDVLSGISRTKLLRELAKYKKAYAIDRCAIEAKVLGCELLELDTRYSVDHIGEVLDNKDAAKILQAELDKIDGGNDGYKDQKEAIL